MYAGLKQSSIATHIIIMRARAQTHTYTQTHTYMIYMYTKNLFWTISERNHEI